MSAAGNPEPASTLAHATWHRDRDWRPFPLDHPALNRCAGLHHPDRNPCDGKRGKHPVVKFGTACNVSPADGLLRTWFGEHARNIGIACGPSGLLVVDEDQMDALTTFAEGRGELPVTYRVRTQRGWHWYFDATEYPELGNGAGLLGDHGMDVRGKGGFVVAAGSLHQSGHLYVAEDEHVIPAALPEWLAIAIQTRRTADGDEVLDEGGRWDDAVRFGTEHELIEQYRRRVAGIQSKGNTFRTDELFPAARDGWRLVNLGLLTVDQMGEDLRAAVRRVWGADPDERDRVIVNEEARTAALKSPWALTNVRKLKEGKDPAAGLGDDQAAPDDDPAADDQAEPESSWVPVDLDALWDEAAEPRRPDHLHRDDGVAMFYKGKSHSVHGESESGKSWVGQSAALERLRAGEHVLYIDYEDDARSVLLRMRALGMTRDLLPLFCYVCPEGPQDWRFAELLTRPYALCIIDGVTVAMSQAAKKSNDQDEYTTWYKALPGRVAKHTGAAVVQIDHVSKARDERGRFAVGTQAKMSNVTGSAFYVDVHTGLGQGRTGELRLYVGKDRPGGVRAHAGKMRRDRLQPFARYVHDATDPTRIAVSIVPWLDDDDSDEGAAVFVRETEWNTDVTPLPDDIVTYRGAGRAGILGLARFMRAGGAQGVGMNLADAKAALGALKGMDGKPVYKRDTVKRAWGALADMGRIEPSPANPRGNAEGNHWWVERPSDPRPAG